MGFSQLYTLTLTHISTAIVCEITDNSEVVIRENAPLITRGDQKVLGLT